jgi:hypothetical protein
MGTCVDDLIATKAMRWHRKTRREANPRGIYDSNDHAGDELDRHWFDEENVAVHIAEDADEYEGENVFSPSTRIEDAWLVVEKMGLSIGTCAMGSNGKPAAYWVGYNDGRNRFLVGDVENRTIAVAETAPLAVCLAALKAKEEKET